MSQSSRCWPKPPGWPFQRAAGASSRWPSASSTSCSCPVRSLQLDEAQRLFCGFADGGHIFGTGCNTDGQLGLGPDVISDVYELTRMPVPPQVADEGVVAIRAGADTSALLTSSGSLWTWGNSVRTPCSSAPRDRQLTPLASRRRSTPKACTGARSTRSTRRRSSPPNHSLHPGAGSSTFAAAAPSRYSSMVSLRPGAARKRSDEIRRGQVTALRFFGNDGVGCY